MGLYCLDCHAQNPNDSGTLEHKPGCSFGSDQLNSELIELALIYNWVINELEAIQTLINKARDNELDRLRYTVEMTSEAMAEPVGKTLEAYIQLRKLELSTQEEKEIT